MPRGDPVNGVGIVRDPDSMPSQLVAESYRPRARSRRRRRERHHLLLKLLRPTDQRPPDPLPLLGIEPGKNLPPPRIEHNQVSAGIGHRLGDRVEGADPGYRQAEAGAEPARGGDADPQARERAGPEPDREQADLLPVARGGGAALDLLEQGGRVLGPPIGGSQ